MAGIERIKKDGETLEKVTDIEVSARLFDWTVAAQREFLLRYETMERVRRLPLPACLPHLVRADWHTQCAIVSFAVRSLCDCKGL